MGLCDFEGQDQEACFQGGKEGLAERGGSYFNIRLTSHCSDTDVRPRRGCLVKLILTWCPIHTPTILRSTPANSGFLPLPPSSFLSGPRKSMFFCFLAFSGCHSLLPPSLSFLI